MSSFSLVLSRTRILAAFLVAGALAACGGDGVVTFLPPVVNVADNFQLQPTIVTDLTTVVFYPWVNTGSRATVTHSTTTTSGTAVLAVKDVSGAFVYSKTLSSNLTEPTSTGQTGTWWIQLTFTHFTGMLNFRVQKL